MKITETEHFDVVVIGGSPGGIAAAVTAARLGSSVALVEYHAHLGGMAASGLGKSDIESREMIRGIFEEFVKRIRSFYVHSYGDNASEIALCRDGYYFEPSVAELIFDALTVECPSIKVFRSHALSHADVVDNVLRQARIVDRLNGNTITLIGGSFVDATYEGDLYALAGAAYRLGRESRGEFGEPHAGEIYNDFEGRQILPQSTGSADHRLPAYTYRLCLTTDPANSFYLDRPPTNYDRTIYLPYLDDLKAGRLGAPRHFVEGRGYNPKHFDTMVRALSITELPNSKVDANINPRPLAFPFPEENIGYVEGDWLVRERISRRHRELTLGLLYFLQYDPLIPVAQRHLAQEYQLPVDEFVDNQHFPFQLYIREARRLRGCYTLTEHDISLTTNGNRFGWFDDAIAVGEFPIDSFPARKRQPNDDRVLEGYLCMLDKFTRPYQIPYRVMIPESLDGVIVPVAASATHVAYSSIRMEPTWMAMGQAAGAAAHLTRELGCTPRAVPPELLQTLLRELGQVIDPLEATNLDSVRSGKVLANEGNGQFTAPHQQGSSRRIPLRHGSQES